MALSLFSCAQQDKIKVACVGDSITFGSGLSRKDSYPSQLSQLLGSDWNIKNFGLSGATMLRKGDLPYWESQEFDRAKYFAPDIVIIKLGTNDAKDINWKFSQNYVDDYKNMIQVFSNLESKPTIFICSPAPIYPNSFIDGAIIENEILNKIDIIATDTGVKIIPLFQALSDKSALFHDGIHPDKKGAKIIADHVQAFLLENYKRN